MAGRGARLCVCVFECHLGLAPGLGFWLPSVGVAFMSAKCVCVCVQARTIRVSFPQRVWLHLDETGSHQSCACV